MAATGFLEGQLAQIKEAIRKAPSDGSHRAALFQIYCLSGNWTGAVTQLDLLEQLVPQQFMFAQVYRKALTCEAARREVFLGKALPTIFGSPNSWMGELVQCLRFAAAGEWAAARISQSAAFAAAPAVSGSVNGTRFAWIADADCRLGPALEAFVEGEYQWIPFDQIKAITFTAPRDVIDSVWLPATFTWPNEGRATGFIPVRYPASEISENEAIKVARLTEWCETEPDFFIGFGQRTFTTDVADYGLLDLREIALDTNSASLAA